MSQHDAIIRIKNLRLRTFIGIKEEEIANRQDIVINVVINTPQNKRGTTEDSITGPTNGQSPKNITG